MRLLIVNADDFGLNASSNAGIIESFRVGSVTSTTLMANAPGLNEAVALAKANPSLSVGLHFNMTWGKPLSTGHRRRTMIAEDGEFLGRSEVGRRAIMGRLCRDELEQELEAQFQHLRSLGIRVSHIDSHQHVHAFSPVFSAVAKLCVRENLPMRVPWVSSSRGATFGRSVRRGVLAMALAPSVRRWRGRVRWNDGLGSVFDHGAKGAPLTTDDYRSILLEAPANFELMVHPVTSASAMDGYTRVGAVGEAEYQWLRTGALPGLAASLGFRLGSFSDLTP